MTSSTTICRASTIADGGADGGGDASLPPATGTPTDRLVTADMPYSLREVGDDGSQLNYRLVTPEGVSGVVRDIMGNLTVTQVKPKQFAGTILRTSTFTRSPCRPFVTSDQQAWSFDGTAYAAVTPFVVGAEKLLMSACDPNYQAWLTTEALWTVNTLPSNFNPSTVAVKAPVPAGGFGEPSAMVFLGEDTIIGNRAGELFLCTGLNPVDCSQKQTVSAAPGPHEILDITFTNTVDSSGKQVNPGYILATDGLYLEQFPPGSLFNTFGPAPKLVAPGDFSRPADANVQQSFQIYANNTCGFFTSKQGAEWVNFETLARGFVATASFGKSPGKYPITSIVGDSPNGGFLLWTLTAPAAEGGAIYRSEIPAECGRNPARASNLRSQCVVYGTCGDAGSAGCCSGVCNPNGTCRP